MVYYTAGYATHYPIQPSLVSSPESTHLEPSLTERSGPTECNVAPTPSDKQKRAFPCAEKNGRSFLRAFSPRTGEDSQCVIVNESTGRCDYLTKRMQMRELCSWDLIPSPFLLSDTHLKRKLLQPALLCVVDSCECWPVRRLYWATASTWKCKAAVRNAKTNLCSS